jgi:hypothetical protein
MNDRKGAWFCHLHIVLFQWVNEFDLQIKSAALSLTDDVIGWKYEPEVGRCGSRQTGSQEQGYQ